MQADLISKNWQYSNKESKNIFIIRQKAIHWFPVIVDYVCGQNVLEVFIWLYIF